MVDDGSEDQTPEILEELATQDSRIILLRQSNSGAAAARNLAIYQARGEFIAPIDADDIWHPCNIEKQVKQILQADFSVGVVYAWSFDIDEENQPTGGFHASTIEGRTYATLLCHYFLGNGSSSLIRRTCLDKVGGYSLQLKNSCEDWDLHLRLAKCCQFKAIPEFLICYRKKVDGLSQNLASMKESHTLMLEFARKEGLEIHPSIYRLSDSSFCIYLAHQSYFKGSYQNVFSWIYQAFSSDLLLSLFRLSVYSLLIKSIFGLIFKFQVTENSKTYSDYKKTKNAHASLASEKNFLFPDFNPNPLNRKLKTLIEKILHLSIERKSNKQYSKSSASFI